MILRRNNRKLDEPRHASRGLDVFAGIAHDLRSPLATINTSAELLEQEVDSDTSTYLINVIQRQVHRLQLMIQDISEYAGFESGKVLLHPGTVDLTDLVKETCTDVQEFDKSHNLAFEIPAMSVRVSADSHKLRRALENLLHNAFKYSAPGTTVKARLRTEDGTHAVIEIEDEGPGVPERFREQIFQPYVRLDGTRGNGQGLGLNVVKLIVEAHGGKTWVEDAPVGARFCLRLPI